MICIQNVSYLIKRFIDRHFSRDRLWFVNSLHKPTRQRIIALVKFSNPSTEDSMPAICCTRVRGIGKHFPRNQADIWHAGRQIYLLREKMHFGLILKNPVHQKWRGRRNKWTDIFHCTRRSRVSGKERRERKEETIKLASIRVSEWCFALDC